MHARHAYQGLHGEVRELPRAAGQGGLPQVRGVPGGDFTGRGLPAQALQQAQDDDEGVHGEVHQVIK